MRTAALEAAFRATTYRVTTAEASFALRIGVADPAFDAFLLRHAAAVPRPAAADRLPSRADVCWGIVTAYNPGALLASAENRVRQRRLQQQLVAGGWCFLSTGHFGDAGDWPEEPGYLILHAEEEQVRRLASEFGQLAVVCGRTGSAPRLVWL
ncbi:MAG: DUF3293 domain-containing protein [Candidatus Accumulibacter sp.]|nr:DUF3293 domain-containing protein [Accumulibacter sp.]